MLSLLHKLKNQFVLLLGAIIGSLVLYINVLKKTALKRELDRTKELSDRKDRAYDALIKGNDEENKSTKRGYFDD